MLTLSMKQYAFDKNALLIRLNIKLLLRIWNNTWNNTVLLTVNHTGCVKFYIVNVSFSKKVVEIIEYLYILLF